MIDNNIEIEYMGMSIKLEEPDGSGDPRKWYCVNPTDCEHVIYTAHTLKNLKNKIRYKGEVMTNRTIITKYINAFKTGLAQALISHKYEIRSSSAILTEVHPITNGGFVFSFTFGDVALANDNIFEYKMLVEDIIDVYYSDLKHEPEFDMNVIVEEKENGTKELCGNTIILLFESVIVIIKKSYEETVSGTSAAINDSKYIAKNMADTMRRGSTSINSNTPTTIKELSDSLEETKAKLKDIITETENMKRRTLKLSAELEKAKKENSEPEQTPLDILIKSFFNP